MVINKNIEILRLSHRIPRDIRVSTHVALSARALGASKLYYSGDIDEKMEDSIKSVVNKFGGNFSVEYIKNPLKLLREKKSYIIINLTMYGLKVKDCINKIRKENKILIIIGSEKVPFEYYNIANYNISITNQPHSEISSLAIFLHEYFKGKELDKDFKNAKLKIIPMKKGKLLKEKDI